MTGQSKIQQLINGERIVADGATGTNLFEMGLMSGDAPELWNFDYPERISELHTRFLTAGSDLVLTNSFGGNAMRLKLHNSQDRVRELNEKAGEIARDAVRQVGNEALVGGSIGPTGELLAPLGTLTYEEAVEVFADQALALEAGGCDILWIETFSAEDELRAAAEGVSRSNLPFACCASFDTNGKTMMGLSAKEFVNICLSLNPSPAAVGSNCGIGPPQTVAAVLEMAENSNGTIPLIAKANCGVPQWVGAEIKYTATPQEMHRYAQVTLNAGASIVGGCCGTTEQHVARIHKALITHELEARPNIQQIEQELGEVLVARATEKTPRRRSRRKRHCH